jgi:predicted HAD superfamily Cof-like phosphohydrolase
MTQEQRNVLEFHRTFGLTVNEKPTIASLEDRKLRAALILEEAIETIYKGLGLDLSIFEVTHNLSELPEAIKLGEASFFHDREPSLVELADGLSDSGYVNNGTAVTFGIDLEPINDEVHRSNMSKLWRADETPAMPEGSTATAVRSGYPHDRTLIVKRADGKVLKSPSYRPANLAPILEQQSK